MKTMHAMQSLKAARKQKGFTIIELVVVILLLGILTATALPRFMDFADEAHGAIIDGVQGSLQTGVALYQAKWYAMGQPSTGVEGTLTSNPASGYPMATNSTQCLSIYTTLLQANGLPTAASLDGLVPSLNDTDDTGTTDPLEVTFGAPDADAIATAGATASFVAVLDSASANTGTYYCADDGSGGCTGDYYTDVDLGVGVGATGEIYNPASGTACNYYYTGQYKTPASGLEIPVLSYNQTSGLVQRAATDFTFEP